LFFNGLGGFLVSELLRILKSSPFYRDQIAHHETIRAKKPLYKAPSFPLSKEIRRYLKEKEIDSLYWHQTEAIDKAAGGKNIVVVTPTASGKTLVYNIPVMEALLKDPETKALYIFPLKALEQDQFKIFSEFSAAVEREGKISSAVYDGDTSPYRRKKIRENLPGVIITNPDMLHFSLLCYHAKWEEFFRRLRFVVIDELHTYRGIFGSHVVQVLRRLNRVCQFYGTRPQFITCSATISNPKKLAEELTGLPFDVIEKNGAPKSGGHFVFARPEVSPYTFAARIFRDSLKLGLKTIMFTKARKITELLYTWVVQNSPDLKEKISSYRAGFLPEERRIIEAKLSSGEMEGVISTSALEMGIDIGGLDVCILVGYPGTVTSTWQRSGRVGRTNRSFLIILVPQTDALDQYFIANPDNFFQRGFEEVVVDPDNEEIIREHLVCAASEIPLRGSDPFFEPARYRKEIEALEQQGRLLKSATGSEWFSHKRMPQKDVDIRCVGEGFSIFEEKTKMLIGKLGGNRAFTEGHPGAIYLHKGKQYLITRLDIERKNILAKEVNETYYTHPLSEKETEILKCMKRRPAANFLVNLGRLKVTEHINGYEKRRIAGQELISTHPLDLPSQQFETIGIWIEIEDELQEKIKREGYHFMGSIHAVEHASIAIFPLFSMCDRDDIGGICYPIHPQVRKSAIFIYDGYPGGIGLAKKGFSIILDLLRSTLRLINDCSCDEGCPSCIHSSKCGSGNKPLDKAGAALLLEELLREGKTSSPLQKRARKEVFAREEERKSPLPAGRKKKRILYFDLETQKSAEEVGGWENKHLMRLAASVIYDETEERYLVYDEAGVHDMIEALKKADLVVGFNIKKFDFFVLKGYTSFDFNRIHSFDILEDIHKRLGYRISLGHLAEATLKKEKSGNGLLSVQWFREGNINRVIEYCKRDVEITRELFLFGMKNQYLIFEKKETGLVRIPVNWDLDGLL
jgi:DEAD/DEAH box helicase domain-containing protein